jgi:cytochrome c-type biogenesis protein CcmF
LRQLALATRRQGIAGLLGRANGGMVVHLGVVVVAVALAASNAYTHSATLALTKGEAVEWGGHTFELGEITRTADDRVQVTKVDVLLDDRQVYRPALTKYLRIGQDIGTPSVRTGFTKDVYLTVDANEQPAPGDTAARIQVFVKPMVIWLWIGGAIMAIGTVLAAFPGRRRRRPTDPTSAPIVLDADTIAQPVVLDDAIAATDVEPSRV